VSLADVLRLITGLDALLGLAGKLVALAKQVEPRLKMDPLPDMGEVDDARAAAVKRAALATEPDTGKP
jgi:hypothetical protein